ncbi:hypothetical protein DMH04_48945 [Kibdelosporangium aridum]|uniref:Uncharacterized protein n=1 Tax=Kibdelosporangium aridum TaxID=2030 RepID=A0A428YIV5_KIBAR|nr:hypothetical protein DMH04_48945 [Kibdelosporangium aridum]
MFDALADNWTWIVAGETALLVWLLARPSLKWEVIHKLRSTDVKYTTGCAKNFWRAQLGHPSKGITFRCDTAGHEANVRIVDSRGYRRMRKQQRHAYVGGHYRVSPVYLTVPWPGRRYGITDLGGHRGHLPKPTWTPVPGNLPDGPVNRKRFTLTKSKSFQRRHPTTNAMFSSPTRARTGTRLPNRWQRC